MLALNRNSQLISIQHRLNIVLNCASWFNSFDFGHFIDPWEEKLKMLCVPLLSLHMKGGTFFILLDFKFRDKY